MSMSLQENTLRNLGNPVFIETGTHMGGGVEVALRCMFMRVISVEVLYDRYLHCMGKFFGDSRVTLVHGDSVKAMPAMLSWLPWPATIFLDAHYEPEPIEGIPPTAMYGELDAIKASGQKNHIIMIDDVHCWEKKLRWGSTVEQEMIVRRLLEINPAYQIVRMAGRSPQDVLVALPPGRQL